MMVFACKTNDNQDDLLLSQGYEYFPLTTGLSRIYQVDSIAFDDNDGSIDTFQFFYKELVDAKVLGQTETNQHTTILRFATQDTNKAWLPRASAFALQTNQNLQLFDDNIRYVKLTFPLGNIGTWNGNMYNSLGRRNYVYQGNNFSYTTPNGWRFDQCVQIQEANIKNAIEEIVVRSLYAPQIGLVQYSHTNINTQGTSKSGYILKQSLIAFY